MEDLLQSQIRDSCRLALPEGLKDLMSDISREVLRAQPQNLYQFIADYLSSLLVVREHLFIASRVCDNVCLNRCCKELEDELREMSLTEEDLQKCMDIVAEYFATGEVKESNLLETIVRQTVIEQTYLPVLQDAVRRAFLRHQMNNIGPIESSDSEVDDTTRAANHTLRLYKQVAKCPDVNYHCVATKIQAAYRAYNVRRQRGVRQKDDDAAEKVRFQVKHSITVQKEHTLADVVETKRCARKCSSASLAGSFMSLPLYKPYSIGQRSDITEVDEVGEAEKEHANFNYVTNELANRREEIREPEGIKGKKTISFHHMPHVVELDDNDVMDEAEEADYESEEVEEDLLAENFAVERSSGHVLNEQIPDDNDAITSPEILITNEPEEDNSETSEAWTDDIRVVVNKLSIVAKNSAEMLRTKRDVSRLNVTDDINDQVKTTEDLTDADYEEVESKITDTFDLDRRLQ